MIRRLVWCLFITTALAAQQIEFHAGQGDAAMRGLAERLIAASTHNPDTLLRLQLVAGRYADAEKTLAALPPAAANVRWEIYARAKRLESEGTSFDEAFQKSFRERMRTIDDETAYRVLWSFGTALPRLQSAYRDTLARHKDATSLSTADAVDLVQKYLSADAYGSFATLVPILGEEDDRRRYIIEKDLALKMPHGATICTTIVRPRTERKLPALLTYTIYAEPDPVLNDARRTASNGYIGVIGLTRGKGCSPDTPVPYEHDSIDAAALIDWIAAQSWSDGRVGMYGGSYSGGTAWAAAKRMPKALKGIMNGAPVAPGLDVPMEGNIFWSFVYPWTFYTTNVKTLDNDTYNDSARWQKLDREWYVNGRAYRELDKIDGTPNPIFRTWLAHPGYDAYWQSMIPYKKEFERIDIPVLTTAGYYYGGPGAAVHYFTEHTKYRPNAEHYFVIGPYDHLRGHGGTISVLGTKYFTNLAGYEIEPALHIDMGELRYEWFDYVFGRGPRPQLLADKVNYAVVGANKWKHAPSIAAMANGKLRIPFTKTTLTVNLADRSDVDRPAAGGGVVDKVLDTSNGFQLMSAPFEKAAEVSGLFSGHLEVIANKKDFDFQIVLYELTKAGDYMLLAPYWSRASYIGHPEQRRLLTPGKRQRIDFESIRLMSRQVQPGSRIVAVVNVIKESGRQINYGTGKDVSDETIADAKEPLRIEWLAGSYLDVPVFR